MNMLATIVPKSDQLNADDLIGGRAMTILVTKVDIKMDEQPVSIHFEGDGGKPYRPGKSMRRVLVNVWGPDANVYVGRSMTLYRDDGVKFGGVDVGGIRISHLSHIDKPITMALTATKAQRKPFTVKPLTAEPPPKETDIARVWLDKFLRNMEAAQTADALAALTGAATVRKNLDGMRQSRPDLSEIAEKAIADAQTRIAPPPIDNAPENAPLDADAEQAAALVTQINACQTGAEVRALAGNPALKRRMDAWKKDRPELFKSVDDAAGLRLLDVD